MASSSQRAAQGGPRDHFAPASRTRPCSDTHCHTLYSDGCATLETLVQRAGALEFAFVTKTDHNTLRGNETLARLCARHDLPFIPGIEISTRAGHLLGYNVTRFDDAWRALPLEAIIEHLHDQGAVAVMAHPFDKHGLHERVFAVKGLDGFELLNGASPRANLHALAHASSYPAALPRWAGSDSHAGIIYGRYYTSVDAGEARRVRASEIVEAMWHGRVAPHGPVFPLGAYLHDGLVNQLAQWRRKRARRRE